MSFSRTAGDLFVVGYLNDYTETGKIIVTVKNRDELKWIIPLAVVSLLVFANSLGGDFVYDDNPRSCEIRSSQITQ